MVSVLIVLFLHIDNIWNLFDSFKIFKSKFLTEKPCWENKLIKIYWYLKKKSFVEHVHHDLYKFINFLTDGFY